MILDKQNMLSEAQAVTASAVSTNTIDLSLARDIAAGEDLSIFVAVDEAATASGSATVDFQVISSAAANLGSPTVLSATGPIGKAELTLGRKLIELKVPRAVLLAQPVGQRYLGIQYVVATGPLTAGKFTAGIVVDFQDQKVAYASGFSIT
jgi:hypothetical protein